MNSNRVPRVAIIGTTGLPARYGGFETLAHHMVDQLKDNFQFTVYCSDKYFARRGKRKNYYNGARLKYLPFNANGYQSIIYDIFSMFHAIRHSDVLVVLGVSGAILFPLLRLISSKPIIVNIDGQEWRRPKWNRFVSAFLKFSEACAVKFAHEVIGDNEKIVDYVKKEYGRKNTQLIEYGADHTHQVSIDDRARLAYNFLNKPYAFSVCRIEPENNIHIILDAFAETPSETIVFVGLWNHSHYGIDLKEYYSRFENIHLLDPIYEQEKLDVLRSNAALYIHGHSAGGTNPSLVEAMYLSLPVFAFDVDFNRVTTENAAHYFVSTDELVAMLKGIDSDERQETGRRLSAIAHRRYIWKNIAGAYYNCISYHTNEAVRSLESSLKNQAVDHVKIELPNLEKNNK
jgi:glycosyltransferase involved in cell wall biosynthesis